MTYPQLDPYFGAMKRILPLLIPAVLTFSCSENEIPENVINEEGQSTSIADLNVSEKSELAALMRVMEAHADSVAASFANEGPFPQLPIGVDRLKTASPTKDMHIDAISFPIFVDEYQVKLTALHSVADSGRRDAYNALVQTCANCHYTHCPGPLMKIEKMFVEE